MDLTDNFAATVMICMMLIHGYFERYNRGRLIYYKIYIIRAYITADKEQSSHTITPSDTQG